MIPRAPASRPRGAGAFACGTSVPDAALQSLGARAIVGRAVRTEVFELLHDGVVVGMTRSEREIVLSIAAPHLRARIDGSAGEITIRLSDVDSFEYLPYEHRWDDPPLVDPEDVVRAIPDFAGAALERGELAVYGSAGVIRTVYGALSLELEGRPIAIESLRAAASAFWEEWRALQPGSELHPQIREALRGRWSEASMAPLLEAWRAERTSDLADTIEALDRALHPPKLPDAATPEELADFRASLDRAPGRALDRLARAALATFDLLADCEPSDRSALGAWLDERGEASRAWWGAITGAIASLRDVPADPRIGRGVLALLRGPSGDWFRIDQVAHVAGPFVAPDDTPSFADHALALLEVHADAGSAARLERTARDVSIEADCNGAQMSEELRSPSSWPAVIRSIAPSRIGCASRLPASPSLAERCVRARPDHRAGSAARLETFATARCSQGVTPARGATLWRPDIPSMTSAGPARTGCQAPS